MNTLTLIHSKFHPQTLSSLIDVCFTHSLSSHLLILSFLSSFSSSHPYILFILSSLYPFHPLNPISFSSSHLYILFFLSSLYPSLPVIPISFSSSHLYILFFLSSLYQDVTWPKVAHSLRQNFVNACDSFSGKFIQITNLLHRYWKNDLSERLFVSLSSHPPIHP